ncbi:chemotaxis protein CheB [Gimesia aquarii]|uniref:histidine kinase n=1 Tax=Gimesia aquarii TaxID=2527964 RepID=A0A517X1W5_9PLAN|nr:chemotaxis protein CheB [Gimesia aquarii]QDU11501.1 Autoinducer 2 sensor kinase/phosphatase LuxQ [Gimesia aquarii]
MTNSGQKSSLKVQSSQQNEEPADEFHIVGVGASAGGLEALELMFKMMPDDAGMAFVIVQHLSPDFKSLMDELMARHTKMRINRVVDGMVVEPNSLYLIPPKQDMVISDGKLLLTEKDTSQSLSLPIDHFLRTLAQDVGRRSIAVILSGTGSDGSRGIRDIHEAGGLVVAQSPQTSKFDGMPKSAIDTGIVDVIVPPEKISDVLERYINHLHQTELDQPPLDESSIEHVFRLLQERHRIDFNHYKPSTIGRRIERRIQLNHHGNIDEYVNRLEKEPGEVDQLYKDLLIGVTRFFRDREAFKVLKTEIIPQLLPERKKFEEFRAWVAGCGTGEEVYSIAILINEYLRETNRNINVKIFATDVHQASIDVAHLGIYPETSLGEMEQSIRDRHFIKTEDGYQISSEIRKMIVFAQHNLVKDAPFTRLDMISCRNLLIYLRTMAQKKVLSLFHFGLKTEGILFLGSSESPGELAEEFETLHERWRFFKKRRDIKLPAYLRDPINTERERLNAPARMGSRKKSDSFGKDLIATYDNLLERFMPTSVLVNEHWNVLQLFAGAGKYLVHNDGRLSTNLLEMIDDDLRLALAGGLHRVSQKRKAIRYNNVLARTSEGETQLNIQISLMEDESPNPNYLVQFEEIDVSPEEEKQGSDYLDVEEVTRNRILDLEQEVRYTKENLQATIEELETSNEELQATNEEMVASNEELQSTNEELHSVNEELYTVNAEYQNKIAELTELTDDMNNLLVSTEVHTLFLDDTLSIRKFTPRMAQVFNFISTDVGRKISAFTHNIICDELVSKIQNVLDKGETYEEKVLSKQNVHFYMRVLPYKSAEYVPGDEIPGIVLTLIDISSLVEAEESIQREQERFSRAIAANRDGTWDWTNVGNDEMWWSPNCYTLLGYKPDEFPALHSEWLNLIHPDDRERVQETSVPGSDSCYVELHRDFEYRMLHKTDGYRWFRHRAIVDHDVSGKPVRMTGSVGDIHDRKCAEMQKVEEILKRDNFLAMLSHELRNPMGAVLNAISLIQDKTYLQSQASGEINTDAPQIIERQTRHMARLLDDLLDIARFGQGKIEFRLEVVDVIALAQEVLESVNYQIGEKSQTLHMMICDGPIYIYADPIRIKQAQVNLLNNASKYTPEGNDIWYSIDYHDHQVCITVQDNGDGIPSELLASIFELFVQSDSTLARSAGGLGVGLSLARSIVTTHGGDIQVESDGVGKGSTFRIFLPMTDKTPKTLKHEPDLSFEGCKILLVEDNFDARNMLAETLQIKGFEVSVAGDGLSGLELYKVKKPDVAVIDIGLPRMDGYQLAREIRKQNTESPAVLIALTGYGRQSDQEAALAAGFDTHLVKPIDPGELIIQIIQQRASIHPNLSEM